MACRAARRTCSSCSAISATISRCWRLPVALARWRCAGLARWWHAARRCSRARGRAAPNPGVNRSQALNIWIIQVVVAIGPPLGALDLHGLHEDRLGHLAVLPDAAGAGRDSGAADAERSRCFVSPRSGWSITLAVLAASPLIAAREMARNPNGASTYGSRSELARELTEAWHARFITRWAVVAGTTEIGEPMTFYSPGSSGAVHARRSLVVRADLARRSQAARLHRHLRHHRLTGCRPARRG